jgi:ubiquinone/menaquinone biosynthesis C-methylase UbiE
MVAIPERLGWLVDLLEVGPNDRLLEIGCGRGVAIDLVCARLGDGQITGLDRSAKAIEAAQERNAHWVEAGRADFHHGPATALGDVAEGSIDTVFAMNVNLFWVQSNPEELGLVRRALAPGGTVHLAWEAPGAAKAGSIEQTVSRALADHGFSSTTVRSPTNPALLCLSGRVGEAR